MLSTNLFEQLALMSLHSCEFIYLESFSISVWIKYLTRDIFPTSQVKNRHPLAYMDMVSSFIMCGNQTTLITWPVTLCLKLPYWRSWLEYMSHGRKGRLWHVRWNEHLLAITRDINKTRRSMGHVANYRLIIRMLLEKTARPHASEYYNVEKAISL